MSIKKRVSRLERHLICPTCKRPLEQQSDDRKPKSVEIDLSLLSITELEFLADIQDRLAAGNGDAQTMNPNSRPGSPQPIISN